MKIFIFSAILFLTFLSPATAQEQGQEKYKEIGLRLKNCKAITSLITRAQCYDGVVVDFNLDDLTRVDIGTTTGKWKVTSEKSPVDDSQNIFAAIHGNDYIRNQEGKFVKPSLVLRCKEGKMEGYIIWNEEVGKEDVLINVRVGKGEQKGSRWKLSADKTASFIPDAAAFATSLIDQESFYVSAWTNDSDPLDTTFDIRGVNIALQPLIKACP